MNANRQKKFRDAKRHDLRRKYMTACYR